MNIFVCLISLAFLMVAATVSAQATDVFFGTARSNTDQREGVYHSKFDPKTGNLHAASLLYPLEGAGWVTFHPSLDVVYATGNVDGKAIVEAIFLNESGELADGPAGITTRDNPGGRSCYITTDRTGKLLISAQYSDSTVTVFPISDDGHIEQCSQLITHDSPPGVHANQEMAHPHYVAISPDNRFAFACDLGMDSIVGYEIDLEKKKLVEVSKTESVPGGGPRHMKFHPSGKFVFLINELTLSVSVYGYDEETGTLKMLDTVAALTEEEKSQNEFNSGSEIRVHRSGKFVYSANRGHDSISVFQFDEETGELERTGVVAVRGAWPRNFSLTPKGDFLLVACKDTNNVTVFDVDQQTGALKYRQHRGAFVPAPICVAFDDE